MVILDADLNEFEYEAGLSTQEAKIHEILSMRDLHG
jgi:hypothetical protein